VQRENVPTGFLLSASRLPVKVSDVRQGEYDSDVPGPSFFWYNELSRRSAALMTIQYLFYFLVGGMVITVVTYFASHSKTLLAAFFANLPVITLITFLTIYHEAGEKAVTPYAKGLLIMLFPWLSYIFAIIMLTPRLGFPLSLATGFALYLFLAYFAIRIF
jgi:uncharacterized membrane protein (GlpM family)